jgi:hypothetical protein
MIVREKTAGERVTAAGANEENKSRGSPHKESH